MTRLHRPAAGLALGALLLSACEAATTAPCESTGSGNLTLNITGLPAGVAAKVFVTDAGGSATPVTATTTLTGLSGGAYLIASLPVAIADSTVSGYVRGTVPSTAVCVRDGETRVVPIPHVAIGSAGKVWVGEGFNSLGFTSNQLGATATLAPAVTAATNGSDGAAFDQDGNLWVRGQGTSGAYLMRYSASSLGTSGAPVPDRMINIAGVNCEGSGALAFDESGRLWVSIACQQRVVSLSPTQLSLSGTVTPAVQITGLVRPIGLAFDASRNLWVADSTHLRRFDEARLGSSITTAADLRVTFTTPSPPSAGATALSANHLAFSTSGELWVSSFSERVLYRVESAVRAATGAQSTQVTRILYFSDFAQPRGFAFDNSGGLLIAYFGSSFARLSPTQLQSSVLFPSTVTPQKVYATSSIVTFAQNVALFPAPATTPLYSRVR